MDANDALKLCRYVKACCPQQAIDEFTPIAWAQHLADVPYADAHEACKRITAAQPFVTIAEVLKIVKQIRNKRITDAGDLTPPTGLTDAEERAWLGEARRQIGDGLEVHPDHGELKQRFLPEMRALMPRPEESR